MTVLGYKVFFADALGDSGRIMTLYWDILCDGKLLPQT
jgi:hypothetical protein